MTLAQTPKQKAQPHHRKRTGQHHKTSKHYVKTYWPYLPMALIASLGVFVNTLWSQAGGVLGYATNVGPVTLLQETNIQRLQHDSGALALNNDLSKAAQEKANDMAARGYWSHTSPDGNQPWQLITAAGYDYDTAGENLAYGFDSSAFTVSGWMNSPTHRDNLLNTRYKDVGFGTANSPNYQGHGEQTIVVALYASPAALANGQAAASSPQTQDLSGTGVTSASTLANTQQLASPRDISRIDALTGGAVPWLIGGLIIISSLAAISFIYRHGKLWHKYLVKGERFLIKHPLYDIAIVAAVVVSVILSRTSGTVH